MKKEKFYVTFGQAHKHKYGTTSLDKDTIIEVQADSYKEVQSWAMETFEGMFSMIYSELPEMKYFPKGRALIIII